MRIIVYPFRIEYVFSSDLRDYIVRPFVTKGRDEFAQTMTPFFETAKHHVCKITRLSGADISHSSTVDESLVTTLEWLVVAELIKEPQGLPFKVGQKLQVDGVSLWWWKEGKIIRSANYGALKPIH